MFIFGNWRFISSLILNEGQEFENSFIHQICFFVWGGGWGAGGMKSKVVGIDMMSGKYGP